MIRNFLSRFFHRKRTGRKSLTSPRRYRRVTVEPLETRRLLAATGSISGFVYLDPANASTMASGDAGFPGMTIELQSVGNSGSTTLVSPGGITTTGTDGSYSFTGVAAGTYQVQITPSTRLDVGPLSPGSAGGTAGTNEIQLTLTAGQAATDYNFAILGANPSYISARMDLALTGTLGNYLTNSVLTPPTLSSTGSNGASSTAYSTNYTPGGTPVAVAPNATINSTESPNLLWLTATIENPVGSGDTLAATIPSGSGLSSNFSGDMLTISGLASAATYQSALQSITYSTSSLSTGTSSPTINIVASDGTMESAVYTTSIAVAPGGQSAPTISGNPVSTSVNAGKNATFTATASGSPTPTVQWEVNTGSGFSDVTNGGVYSGATTGTLTITGATSTMNGYTYEAVFTNSVGTVTSSSAALTVNSVTTQPANQSVTSGANVTFSAAISNSAESVQWEVNTGSGFTPLSNGGVYSGATTGTLTITGATTSLSGAQYEAVFTNAQGTLTTSAATLTVNSVPAITTQPSAQLAEAGGNATFTAVASGSPTPTVQWEVNTGSGFSDITNGGVYSGATTGTLTITGATTAMNGYTYEAVFTNTAGSVTSNSAALTVDSITAQPASEAVNSGQNATFTATSSNSSDAVQWYVNIGNGFILVSNGASNGAIYSGAITDTLTITDVTQNFNNYQYRAVFTNSAGTLTTSAATLTINEAPVVTTQPSATVLAEAGGNTSLTAAASGSPTPAVQWEVNTGNGSGFSAITNGSLYSGATTGTLTITGATTAMNGYTYEAVFTNSSGSVTTNSAVLTVDSISAQPASQTINAGQNTSFTATSSNSGDTVKWKVNSGSGYVDVTDGGVYSGATTTTLTITGATAGLNADQYEAVFTNSAGTLTSNPATLTVDFPPNTEGVNPAATLADAGGNATFTAVASGNPTPSVQWEVNTGSGFADVSDGPITGGGSYSGATTGTLTITGVTTAMNGYTYEAVFTNTLGSATTGAAALTVDSITAQPEAASINAGQNTAFTATSSNPGDTVQWMVNSGSGYVDVTDGGVYSGATTTTLTITGATAGLNGDQYEAVFSNAGGKLTSSPAALSVDSVTTSPSNQAVAVGGNASFSAASSNGSDAVLWEVNTGSGFTPLSDGGVYSGTATTTLTITGATADLSGNQYEAVFTNSAGTLTSSPATLSVDVAPTVTTNPSSPTLADAGDNASFTAAASGTPAPSVQWEVNTGSGFTDVTDGAITGGGSYSGATTGTLTITGVTAPMNNYRYEAVFTNAVGTATSAPATLSVDYVALSPGSQSTTVGGNVSFTTGSFHSSDAVQWEVNTGNGYTPLTNGGVYSGVTTTTLNITGVTGSMNGYLYEAVFTNSAGSFTSSPATLSVVGAPTITAQPATATTDAGGNATFMASASGTPAPNVLWMVNANNGGGYVSLTDTSVYSGVTTDTLTITGATATMNGYTYEAVFTNSVGSTTTAPATLTVDSVTTQPANQPITIGQNATFTAASLNPTGLDTIQWQVNTGSGFTPVSNGSVPGNSSASYSGATIGTLTITAPTTAMSGYTYEAVFTNALGSITSNPATLSVGVAPDITTEPPASVTADAGGNVSLATVASGTPSPTVQWKANTGNGVYSAVGLGIYGNTATSPTLQITGVTPNMNGYVFEAVYSNSIGTATSTPVTLSVDSVASQPTNQTITAGQNVSFTASSTNSSDAVQWEVGTGGTFTPILDGGVYSGATTGTLTITNATTALNGQQYEAVFTNSAGSFATSPITLSVNAAGTSGPSGYSVTPNVSAYSASDSNEGGFTIKSPSSDNGDTFAYSISSSRGGTPVTGSGTITSTSQAVGSNSLNLQTLYDGTLTFSVTLTNSTGVAGAPATATVLKDSVNPGAFTVTPSLSSYNATTGQQFSFTINHAQVDNPPETYTWVLLSSSLPTNIKGTGQVTSSTMTVPPTNITSLPSGYYTLHVVDTNAAGDGNNANAQVILDEPVPAFTVTPDVPLIGAANATSAGFTVNGAELDTTCTYTVTDSNGKSIVSSGTIAISDSAQDVSPVDVSSLADGTITYKVTLTDIFGNTLTEEATAVLDQTAPSGYSISGVPSTIGVAAAKSFSFTVNSPASENNDTYAYTITSENTGFSGTPITGSGTITATSQSTAPVDITSLPDGPLSITITLTDQAGNVGATTAPLSPAPVLDTVLPSGYTITPDETVISSTAAEATAGFTISSPSAYASNSYTYTWNATDEVGNPPQAVAGPTGSGTLSSASQHVAVDLAGLPDGIVTYSVQLTEPSSGNTGAAATAATTLATSAPTGFTVTPDESLLNATSVQATGFTIQNSNPGEAYSYTITDSTGATLATGSGSLPLVIPAAGYDVTPINLTSLTTPAVGTITFSVTLTDAAGHMGTETGTAVYDPAAPTAIAVSSSTATSAPLDTANPADPANVVGVLESVSGQPGDSYTYSLVSGAGSTDNGSFTISGDQLLKSSTYDGSAQSSFSILVQSTDALGNSIQQQFTITVGTDPIAAALTLSNDTAAAHQSGAVVGTLSGGGATIGNTVNYSLVDEPDGGTNNNSSFTIAGNQLETSGSLAPGTYTVRVRMSSTFLISDVDNLPSSDVTGPLAFQMTYDPAQLPSAAYLAAAANAGLITLGTDGNGTGNWVPAVSVNSANPGSLAQTNYLGSYLGSFWPGVTAVHPSATLADVVGSSGVDLANNAVWAVIDQPGEYAVMATVFTEQVFTIRVGQGVGWAKA